MIKFHSTHSADELISRWDEYTSPSRFAGNDDTMDLIFISKRKNNKVRLIRRSKTSREPFACVFRGTIADDGSGSVIKGIFTKTILDYIVVGLIIAAIFYIRSLVEARGEPLHTMNALLIIAIVGGLALLYNWRGTKKRYSEFISRITDTENRFFLSKREQKEREEE